MPVMNKYRREIRKIGLMGPFGFGNLGDAAIQQSMLENIRTAYPTAQIYGISLNPEDTFQRHGIPSFSIGRMARNGWAESGRENDLIHKITRLANRSSVMPARLARLAAKAVLGPLKEVLGIWQANRHMKDMDLLIVSGGGQLDDYWGGAWHHPYSLFLWGLLARLHGARFLFASVGAGPLDTRLGRLFDRWALALAHYRSFRDQASQDFMRKVGFFRASDPVYPDLAFSLDISRYSHKSPTEKPHPLVVGLGPFIYFRPGVWPEQDQQVYQGYLQKLACFTKWLLEQGHTILLFTGDAEFDRWAIEDYQEILRQMGIDPQAEHIITEPIELLDDLMGQLTHTDMVVASRFHGVLLSLLLNKPVLALSYHSKIDELMQDTGQRAYCLQVDDFSEQDLQRAFTALYAGRDEFRRTIGCRVEQYQADLARQYQALFASND